MRKSLASASTLATAVALFAACSSNKPNPPMTPAAPTDAGSEAGAYPIGSAADDAGAGEAGPTFFTGGADAGASGPVALGEAAIDATIDLAITTAAPKLAPNMEREGQPGRATLKEGEHFSMMVNLAPNRCYTIIANSPSVDKLDLKLFGPPLFNIEAGKSVPTGKDMPVIGKGAKALCPIIPIAVPYKIDVAATKGAGRIAVQVFGRMK